MKQYPFEFLTDEKEQKLRAIEGSYIPTIPSLYNDADVLNAVPFFEGFEQIYRDLVVRPSSQLGDRYHEVSSTYNSAVFDILSGQEPTARLEEAEQVMSRFSPPSIVSGNRRMCWRLMMMR